MQTSASQCNGWTHELLVGTSTSCPGKLDLLGMRKGQVSPGSGSFLTLTHKINRASFPTPVHHGPADPAKTPRTYFVTWFQKLTLPIESIFLSWKRGLGSMKSFPH